MNPGPIQGEWCDPESDIWGSSYCDSTPGAGDGVCIERPLCEGPRDSREAIYFSTVYNDPLQLYFDPPVALDSDNVEDRTYLSYTTEVLDNLMSHGTDRYGTVQSDMLVAILDVRTKLNVTPDYGDTLWRCERFGRRSPSPGPRRRGRPEARPTRPLARPPA